MPTPRDGYYTRDGKRVPGTTTIIGQSVNKKALVPWAYKRGRDGLPLYDGAIDIGTCAHSMVEQHINGTEVDAIYAYAAATLEDAAMAFMACSSFNAYLAWERNFNVKILYQEIQLVSERYRYGGTPDAIGMINGKVILLDWKTSNAVYWDYLVQLAAYKNLWEENNPEVPIEGGCHLLRFAKEHGDFAHHYFPELDDAWEAFKHMRSLYDLSLKLEKRAA